MSWAHKDSPSVYTGPVLSVNSAEANASDPSLDFTVSMSIAGNQDVQFTVQTLDGTAQQAIDYTALAPQTVTISAGLTSAPVSVALINPLLSGPDRQLQVVVSNPVGAIILVASGIGTIHDVTGPPVLSFTAPAAGTYINAANKAAFVISGSCSVASTVMNISGPAGFTDTTTCTAFHTFSKSMDLQTLSDGSNLTFVISQTNLWGTGSASRLFNKNTSGPTAPSALSLLTPASSPGHVATPTVQVSGIASGNTVNVYKDSGCTLFVGGAIASSTTVLVTLSPALVDGSYTFYANQADVAGNVSACSSASVSYVLDTTAPTVTNVTSSLSNGSYKAAQIVPIQITFSKAVLVTGTPTLSLNTTPSQVASYASGSNTSSLTFNYTVQAGDMSSRLDYAATTSLTLAGGTIHDAAGNNVVLTVPGLMATGDLAINKNIVIDTTAPTAPSSLSLYSPSSSPNTVNTPVILVSGVNSGDSVTLYSDSGCVTAASSAAASAGSSIQITSHALTAGTYQFYAQSTDPADNVSGCSTAHVQYIYSSGSSLALSPLASALITGEALTFLASGGTASYTFGDAGSGRMNATTGIYTAPLSLAPTSESVHVTDAAAASVSTTVSIRAFQTKDTFIYATQPTPVNATAIAVYGSNIYTAGYQDQGSGATHWVVSRSADAGATWSTADDFVLVAGGDTKASGVITDAIGTLYVVGSGIQNSVTHWIVRKSTDGGSSWTTVDNFNDGTANGATSLARDVAGNLYVLGRGNYGLNCLIRKSADAGSTWTTVDTYAPGFGACTAIQADGLGNVYASVTGNVSGYDHWFVRKSSNAGSSWTTVDDFMSTNGATVNSLAMDSNNNVYVVGLGRDSSFEIHWIVRKSANGGTSWTIADDYIDAFQDQAQANGVALIQPVVYML